MREHNHEGEEESETMMPKDKGYISTGDRIVVKNVENFNSGFGGTSLREEDLGQIGVVIHEDGWGHCEVRLDNGREISCWNGKNLDYEGATARG